MNLKKLLKIELWKVFHTKNMILCIAAEILLLCIAAFDTTGEMKFQLSEIYLTQYMGIALVIRYIYMAIVVSTLFSKDIETGIFDTYIAVGTKRKTIVIAKMLCLWFIIIGTIMIASIFYIIISFVYNGLVFVPFSYFSAILLSIFPIIMNSLLLIAIDIFWVNNLITVFFEVVLVIATGILPYSIAKWFFLSYNNPILVMLYQGKEDLVRMFIVFFVSCIFFVVMNFRVIKTCNR